MGQLLEEHRLEGLPLLPLPDHVLLPHTLVPFHIHEDRFKELAEHCVSGSRLLVVSGLKPGWEEDYLGSPEAWGIGCLAKVVNEERQRDGSLTLFVHGLARVRVQDYSQLEPFRLANIEVLEDTSHEPSEGEVAGDRLRTMLGELVRALGPAGKPMRKVLGAHDGLGALTHRTTAMLIPDPEARQRVLEARCPLARAEVLTERLGGLLLELIGDKPRAGRDH